MRWMLMAVAAVCLWVCVPNPAEAGGNVQVLRDQFGRRVIVRDNRVFSGQRVFVRNSRFRGEVFRRGRLRRSDVVIVNDRRPVIVRDSRFRSRGIFDSRRGRSLFFGLSLLR